MNITIKKSDSPGWTFLTERDLQLAVPTREDWREEGLLAVHLLVEALIARSNLVSSDQVERFQSWVNDRTSKMPLPANIDLEDQPNCPWAFEHCIARGVERTLAATMGVVWTEYTQHNKGETAE